jgi:histidinol-phosphatase
MLVARGAADVMIEESLRTWDWAALAVIVREAGGRMTRLDGSLLSDGGSVLTTNGVLHDRVLALFSAG